MALQSWLACSVLLGGSVSAQGGPKYYLELEGALTPRSVAYVWDAATGDIDGDGDIDVVVGGERNGNVNPSLPRGSAVQVWINDRGRALVDETTGRITGQPSKALQVLLADVDGDKDLDCVTVPGPRLWINDGKGSFAPRSMTLSPGSESQALLVDVDGDKDLDCVAIPGPRLWINDGKGGFTSKMIPSPGGPLAHCVTGDIDGDSDADLVITLGLIHIGRGVFRATRLAVLINDGKGGFSISSKAPTELVGTRRLHLADFDGDLDLDIFCTSVGSGNSYATRNLLFVNDGKGGFTASSSFPDHQALELARVADLDRDGDLDIICRQTNSSSSQVFLWRNDAKNLFVNRGRLTNRTDATFAPVVADLDRDGDLDVVLSWDSMY
ncbi:MAG: FG-GAP repeat domain-containing protein, partial [Planctomycetota bacterium]